MKIININTGKEAKDTRYFGKMNYRIILTAYDVFALGLSERGKNDAHVCYNFLGMDDGLIMDITDKQVPRLGFSSYWLHLHADFLNKVQRFIETDRMFKEDKKDIAGFVFRRIKR